MTDTNVAAADPFSSTALAKRLDRNIAELAQAVSDLLTLNPESDIDDLSRRLSWLACHARNTASAAGDLKSARREEARR